MKTHSSFQKANNAFDKSRYKHQYKEVKNLYALCTSAKESEISVEEKNCAIYMIMACYCLQKDVNNALIYFRQLGNAHFKSKLLPDMVRNMSSFDVLVETVKQLPKHRFSILDFSNCNLHGASFQAFLKLLRERTDLKELNLEGNPLTLIEVNQLLDTLLEHPFSGKINLQGLPTDQDSIAKIIKLIDKANTKKPTAAIEIYLQSNAKIVDLSALTRALKRVKQREISIHLMQKDKTYTLFSDVVPQQQEKIKNAKTQSQLSEYAAASMQTLEKLIQLQQIKKTDTPHFRYRSKPLKMTPTSWYEDDDIALLLRLKLKDYQPGVPILLSRPHVTERNYLIIGHAVGGNDPKNTIPLGFYLDKAQQAIPTEQDDRQDIFDQLGPLLQTNPQTQITLLFPYNRHHHWLTSEIQIVKHNHHYKINLTLHDPFGGGSFTADEIDSLSAIFKKQITQWDKTASCEFLNNVSAHAARQHPEDTGACGVIVVEDMVKLAQAMPLSSSSPHPIGAESLRTAHLKLTEHCEETLKNAFYEKHHLLIFNNEIIYGEKGQITAHLVNQDGHITLHILNSTHFKMSSVKDLFPCHSLSVLGAGIEISIDCAINAKQQIEFHCKNLVVTAEGSLDSPSIKGECETKVQVGGKFIVDHLQLNAPSFIYQSSAAICAKNPNKSSVQITAAQCEFHGGEINANHIEINAKKNLLLPDNMKLSSDQLNLITDDNMALRCAVKSKIVTLRCNEKVQLGVKGKLDAEQILLSARDISVMGKIENCHHLELRSDESVDLHSSSNVVTETLQLYSKEVITKGELKCTNFICHSNKADLAGQIIYKSPETIVVNEQEQNAKPPDFGIFSIHASALKIDSAIATDARLDLKVDKLFMSARARVQGITSHMPATLASSIQCKKELYLDKGAILAQSYPLVVDTKDLTVYGTLSSNENMQIEVQGKGEIHDNGAIISEKHINLEGEKCWNSGNVRAKESLNIAFDHYFITGICDFNPIAKFKAGKLLGSVSGKNITITTGCFLGLLSNISADNMVQINSFLDFNIGLINGKSISHSSILKIDLGVNITALKSIQSVIDLMRDVTKAVITPDQDVGSIVKEYYDSIDGKSLAMNSVSYALQIANIVAKLLVVLAPQIGIPLSMFVGAISVLGQMALNGLTIKNEVVKLMARHKAGKTIHPRHIYTLILATKNLAMSSVTAVNVGLGMPNSIASMPSQIQNSNESLLTALPGVAGLFAGSVTEQSVVNIGGASATITGLHTTTNALSVGAFHQEVAGAVFAMNLKQVEINNNTVAGTEFISSQNYEQDQGRKVVQSETLIAGQANLSGHNSFGVLQGNLNHLIQADITETKMIALNVNEAQINGQFTSHSGAFQANHLITGQHAKVSLDHTHVAIRETDLVAGETNLTQVIGNLGQLHQGQESQLNISDSVVNWAGPVELNGMVNSSHSTLQITSPLTSGTASQVTLSNQSSVLATGPVSLNGTTTLNHSQLGSDATVTLAHQSKTTLENNAYLQGKELNVDGQTQATQSMLVGEEKVEFKQNAQTTLKESQVVSSHQMVQEADSTLTTSDSALVAKEIDLKGTTTSSHELDIIASEKLTLDTTSRLEKGQDSHIFLESPEIVRKGTQDVGAITYKTNYGTQAVNEVFTDSRTHADAITVVTDQKVVIEQGITATQNATVVAESITDDAKQNLESLLLKSTQGDTTVNQAIETKNLTGLIAENQVHVHAPIKSDNEIFMAGKTGVEVSPASEQKKEIVLFGHRYTNSPHKTFIKPKPVKVSLEAAHIGIESGQDVRGTEVDIVTKELDIDAKGAVVLNGKPTSLPIGGLNSQVKSSQIGTHIWASHAHIQADTFVNNGQVIRGDVLQFQLAHNFYNTRQGIVGAAHFLGIEAENVFNQCWSEQVLSPYGAHEAYRPSYLLGGDGQGYEGIGSVIHTLNKIVFDASALVSQGSNVLIADGGAQFKARSSTYVTQKKEKSSWFGLNQEEEVRQDTVVNGCDVISQAGKNTLVSRNGGCLAEATNFSAAAGTDFDTHGKIVLKDVVGSTQIEKHSRKLGVFYSNEQSYDEFSTPTVVQDTTYINMHSDGDIVARGTYFLTQGLFHVGAVNFDFSLSKLKHTYDSSSFGISGTLCNQQFFSSNNPCNASQPFWNGDPLACQLQQLGRSNGAVEVGLNTWSAGITAANTVNGALNGLRTGTLLPEIMKQEVPGLYAPQLGINFTHTSLHQSSESLGGGGMSVGSAEFNVKETITWKAPVEVAQDLTVKCTKLVAQGEQLHSECDQKIQNVNVSVCAKGNAYQIGVNSSHNKSSNTIQVNEQVNVGGTTTVDIKEATLDGAVLNTNKMLGKVDYLKIETPTNESRSESNNYGASTGGNICFGHQRSESKTVGEASALHVRESINGQPGEFVVNNFESKGGKVISDQVNHFQAGKTNATDVEEYQHTSGFGINTNVNDFKPDAQTNHLLPPSKQCAQITTTNLNFNKSDYKANTQTVIYGAQGTQVALGETVGTVVTDSAEGRKVTENESHNLNIALPRLPEGVGKNIKENLNELSKKLNENEARLNPQPEQKDPADLPPESQSPASGRHSLDNNGGGDDDGGDNTFYHHGHADTAGSSSKHKSKNKTTSEDQEDFDGTSHQDNSSPSGKNNSINPDSSQLEPWQQNAANSFGSGMSLDGSSTEEGNNFESSWEEEAANYYQNSEATTEGKKRSGSYHDNASKAAEEEESWAYVCPKAMSVEEQVQFYYDQKTYEYAEYDGSRKSYFDTIDLPYVRVEDEPRRDIVNSYQNTLAKPKDWHSSLARWERVAVDEMTPPQFESNAEVEPPRRPDFASDPQLRTPIPIYQLPAFRPENLGKDSLTKEKIISDLPIWDTLKQVGCTYFHDCIDPLKEIWDDPKKALLKNAEIVVNRMDPLNPTGEVGDIVAESMLNVGLEYVKGNRIRKLTTLAEIGTSMLVGVPSSKGLSFFKSNILECRGAYIKGCKGGSGLGKLTDKKVTISKKGLNIVEQHLSTFEYYEENELMLQRLRTALDNGSCLTGADASFYIHEINEATRMLRGVDYCTAHQAALDKYDVSPYSVYHRNVIKEINDLVPRYFNENWTEFWQNQSDENNHIFQNSLNLSSQ